MSVTAEQVEAKLKKELQAAAVTVIDTSGGCGSAFEVAVVSPLFDGKPLIARHRLINEALKEEMKNIHALSIKKCWTPAQAEAATGAPAAQPAAAQ